MSSSDSLIHLANVKKVFYTDDVETHALSGIDLDIKKGEYKAASISCVAGNFCNTR